MTAATSVTGSGTTNKNMDILPKMASGSFYLDDAVVYYSTNQTTDVTYPNSPTAGEITTSALKWTNRDDSGDGATGRQATLIWKRTSGTANDLTLNNQGQYVVPANGSTFDQSGHWTLISATVDKDATSYSGTFEADDVYAIVHRDLAYNYSTPAYVTIPGGGGSSCSEPVAPTISGDASYTEGETITLTASHEGTNHSATTTYQWFKGATFATATSVQAAATGAAGYTFTKTAALSDDGSVYWCEAANGTCKSHNETGKTIAVSASSAETHSISYNEASLKGQSVSGYPTEYTEGVGIASFDDLADVTNFHFNGWSPASISASATTDVELTATWVDAYNVTFSYGTGGGTAPDAFQKWQGAKFNLPGQGSMTAPSGKVFDGWKAGGTKYAENAEYTMGNDAVEFVAQWKAVPTTLYSLTVTKTSQVNLNNGGAQDDLSDDATIVGGGAYMQNDHANNQQQILGSTKLQFKAGTVTLVMTLTNALKEGDTIKATGLNSEGLCFGVTFDRAGSLDNQLASDASYFIVPEGFEGKTTLYAWRHSGSGTTCASIIIRRPAERPIATTEITLSDLKVNNHSISSDSLAILTTAPAYALTLKDEYAVAPVIKFNEHTVITYADSELPATKEKDKVYTVTATENSAGKWEAKQSINSVEYTVTANKVSSAKVYYYDGSTKLGEETVAINGSPIHAGDYDDKNLTSFDGWYNNSDLALEHKIADIAALIVTADINVYGKWTNQYATSINIEQWVLDNGKGAKTTDLLSQLGSHYFATGITYVAGTNELDSLNDDPSKDNRNYAYLGLKVKTSGAMLDFRLQNGQTVKVKFGNIGTTPKVQYNNTGDYANMTITDGVYSYTATGNDYISIKTADAKAVVFKQIMIGADPAIAAVTLPWRVTYDANGGTCGTASAIWSGAALILPDVTPADADHTFAGWYDGDDLAGAAGASYNAEANVTLQAHFAPVEYAIAYDGNGETSGSMSAGVAGWGTMVTPDANAFVKTGHVFSGWAITKTSDGSATGITFSEGKFEMPKYDVTLVAQWEDVSKVAVIVETNVKYESLTEAIAAAGAGQTIQLIQDITQEEAILIDKNLTLDLNNKTFTVTNPSSEYSNRAIKVTAGTIVIENGTVDALSNETHNGGCWGSLRQEGGHLTCNHVTFKNYRSGGLGLKPVGGTLILNECTVLSEIGGGLELGNATVEVNNCTFTQTGTDANKIYGACFGMGKMGTLTINGGTYTSDNYSFYIYTSGGTINVNSGTFAGDIKTEMNNTQYPSAVGTINISGGTFDGVGENPIVLTAVTANDHISISGGVFDASIENQYCAYGYVPKDNGNGTYGVKPKDGVEIIGVVTTGGTNKTVTGLYQGDATVNLDSDKKIGSGKYIYVTLASGYTFEETDVLVVDLKDKSDLSGGTKALEITTGVGNIDGSVWKSIAYEDYTIGENTISLEGIAAGQTAIGLKRSANQNAWVNGLKVYRPMKPMLTAITFNGETGAINEANKTVAITLPEATTDLAALTVVPTIVWNAAAAENSIVVNNGAAWQEGANTYKLTDKDGDATTYTITITLQGTAADPVIETQPADVAYCAGSEPTLTVVATGDELHYAWFKEAGETDEAVGSDQATYTVASAGSYYVIVTNHVDTKLDASVTSANAVVTLNVAATITTQPTNKRDVVAGSEVTLSVVAANATGYQWYSCEDAEKHGAAAISGAEAANYVFTCNANGFYYCVVGNACGDDITSNVVSVKLEPEGCNTFASKPAAEPYNYEQTGEWTFYNVDSNGADKSTDNVFEDGKNFDDEDVVVANTRRFALKFEKDVESVILYGVGGSDKSFTKVSVSDELKKNTYTELTATATKTDLTSQQHIYTIEDMIIPAGKYAWFELSGSLKFFKICYTTALAEPKLPTLADQELCAGAAIAAFDATITNAAACEGTVSYKWFSTADAETPVATTAEFTPSTDGTYYVVVTHSAAGHITRTVQSDELSVAHFDALSLVSYTEDVYQHMGTAATLSVVATGKNVAYVWYTCSNAAGDDAEAIVPAATEASLAIASVAEGVQYYKVVISHDCDATTLSHVFKVEGWDELTQVDVTGTTTWDMTNVSADHIELTGDDKNARLLLANIDGVNNTTFNAQALKFEGQHIGRTEANVKHLAGRYVQFNVTVLGAVFVTFASNGNNARTIAINGKKCARTTSGTAADKYITYALAVEPGSVEIVGYEGESANQYVRISKIEFKAEASHTRPGLNPANIGTLCWTNNAILGGATLYELAGKNEYNKLVFDEVDENRLVAGKPYIFVPENGNTEIKLYNTDTEAALTQGDLQTVNGMHGTFVNLSSADGDLLGNYVISKNHYIYVDSDNVTLKAYRAYITSLDDIAPAPAQQQNSNGAPRRRIIMGAQGEQVTTGNENIDASETPVKVMIDGQLYILRGEKMYDATGRLVK